MSTIRTILTADSSGLRREFDRARGALEDYERFTVRAFGGAAGAIAGVGAVIIAVTIATKASIAILEGYAPFDSMVQSLKLVEGTASATSARLETLRQMARDPGLGFEEAVAADVRLRSAGLSAEVSAGAIKGFANALASVGGGKDEFDGIVRALGQISAKGVVAAEEINQIAERLPQIRALMTDAFGTANTEELQKRGITSQQFIEAMVVSLGKMPRAVGGVQNTLDNFSDDWKGLKTQALEFGVTMAGQWIKNVGGAMQQARRDLVSIKEFFGLTTPGLQSPDGTTEEWRQYLKRKEARIAAEVAAAKEEVRIHNETQAFWEKLQLDRTAFLEKEAQRRLKIEQDAAAAAELPQ